MVTPASAQPEVFVARQPIFTAENDVWGYELLFRSVDDPEMVIRDPDLATGHVVAASLFTVGLDRLVGDARAFINCTRTWLVDGTAMLLPPDRAVLEIVPDVVPDNDVADACRELADEGYHLAIDGLTVGDPREALLPHVTIVKIDVQNVAADDRRALVRVCNERGIQTVAQRVETWGQFDTARRDGFDLFQGFYFERPNFVPGHDVPALESSRVAAMKVAGDSEIEIAQLEGVVRHDAGLTYKLLRYLNASRFGWKKKIDSIHQALAMLGAYGARKWLMLATLSALSEGRPRELMVVSAVRGGMCERVAAAAGMENRRSDAFYVGILSRLDAITGRPMTELVESLDLDEDVIDVLLGNHDNPLGHLVDLVDAYESGVWDRVEHLSAEMGIDRAELPHAFATALDWAGETLAA